MFSITSPCALLQLVAFYIPTRKRHAMPTSPEICVARKQGKSRMDSAEPQRENRTLDRLLTHIPSYWLHIVCSFSRSPGMTSTQPASRSVTPYVSHISSSRKP